MNDVGKTIRQLREKKGLTQEELADRINVSIRTIQRFERDKHSSNMKTLEKIAAALGLNSIDALLLGSEVILSDFSEKPENWHQATEKEIIDMALDHKTRLENAFVKLNDPGKEKVVSYAEDLVKVPEYQYEEKE